MDRPNVEAAVRALLESLVPGAASAPGTADTPLRVAKAWEELLAGYQQDPGEILATRFPNEERYDELVLVGPVDFFSTCEHHLLPFHGRAWIGYIPDGRVVGLSKLGRLVECFARRLQLQERMTQQIARAIEEHLHPRGWGVVLRGEHLCMKARGLRSPHAEMQTTHLGGVFMRDGFARQEFLAGVDRSIR